MTPEEMAARSRAAAAANDDLVYGVIVNAAGRGVAPGELAELAGLPSSTTRDVVRRLVGRGLVRREGRRRIYVVVSHIEAGSPQPDPGADQRQLELAATLAEGRELERMARRLELVKERARLDQMIEEAKRALELRRLTGSAPDQRVEARWLTEVLSQVQAYVTGARTLDTLRTIEEAFVRDPFRRAGEAAPTDRAQCSSPVRRSPHRERPKSRERADAQHGRPHQRTALP
jgi:hypothetical protein